MSLRNNTLCAHASATEKQNKTTRNEMKLNVDIPKTHERQQSYHPFINFSPGNRRSGRLRRKGALPLPPGGPRSRPRLRANPLSTGRGPTDAPQRAGVFARGARRRWRYSPLLAAERRLGAWRRGSRACEQSLGNGDGGGGRYR